MDLPCKVKPNRKIDSSIRFKAEQDPNCPEFVILTFIPSANMKKCIEEEKERYKNQPFAFRGYMTETVEAFTGFTGGKYVIDKNLFELLFLQTGKLTKAEKNA